MSLSLMIPLWFSKKNVAKVNNIALFWEKQILFLNVSTLNVYSLSFIGLHFIHKRISKKSIDCILEAIKTFVVMSNFSLSPFGFNCVSDQKQLIFIIKAKIIS